jgi:DNA-binding NarL/FixJ family response regulator
MKEVLTAGEQTSKARSRVRVLLADTNTLDSELVTRGLQANSELRVETCSGIAIDCKESLSILTTDVLVWVASSRCTPTNMFEAVPALLDRNPKLRIIFVLDSDNKENVVNAFRAGAHGVFSRGTGCISALRKCINSVHAGQVWINNAQTFWLIEAINQMHVTPIREAKTSEALTPRQQQTVQLVAEGMGNREIALRLGISEDTVKKTLSTIFNKIGVSNRVQLVRALAV